MASATDITEILSKFNPVSLSELDSLCLMNRHDNKFVFSVQLLPDLLERASKFYKILEINNQRNFYYVTRYLDTPDKQFYHAHQCGRANRFKLRLRTYEVNQLSFLEIKHKTNKGNTEKSRIKVTGTEHLDDSGKKFILKHMDVPVDSLQLSSINYFHRITLASFESRERITIDYNLTFAREDKSVSLPKICIAEIKFEKSSGRSPIMNILKELKAFNTGFSKYCIGTVFLDESIKQNGFKSKKLLIKKIENDTVIY